MEHRGASPLLLALALLSALCWRARALPPRGAAFPAVPRLGNRMSFDGASEPDHARGSLKSESDILQSTLPENEKFYFDLSRIIDRNARHADGIFTSVYSHLLAKFAVKRYLHSLIRKRVRDTERGAYIIMGELKILYKNLVILLMFLLAWWMNGKSKYKVIDYSVPNDREIRNEIEKLLVYRENVKDSPVKRHSDAVFTDNYSRFRKQMAVKKYLNSVLTGKRSQEELNPAKLRDEAELLEPSFSENYDSVDELLSHLPLDL